MYLKFDFSEKLAKFNIWFNDIFFVSNLRKIKDIFAFIAAGIVTISVGFFMLRGTMRMWDKKKPKDEE